MGDDSYNANGFADGRRGRILSPDAARAGAYAASTLPVRGPGMIGRRFPQGSTVTPLPARRSSGGASAPPDTRVWVPYQTVFKTNPPANAAFYVSIAPGDVQDALQQILLPANRNTPILVPANSVNGFFVWLVAKLDTSGAMTSLKYDSGLALPPPLPAPAPDDDSPPPTAYKLLFMLTSDASSVKFPGLTPTLDAVQMCSTSQSLLPVIINSTSTGVTRAMQWTPNTPDTLLTESEGG